ncbi:hypothetical protein ACMGGS_14175 [Superficieibacter sp. BNK-5]
MHHARRVWAIARNASRILATCRMAAAPYPAYIQGTNRGGNTAIRSRS